jgi:PAS domain-containing protein
VHSTGPTDARAKWFARETIDVATVLECTPDGVSILDRGWRFVHLNRRAQELIGGDRDLIGKTIWEAQPLGRVFAAACRKAMAERVPVHCEDVDPRLGIWFENSIYPCGDGIAVYSRDVTARKKREQALRDSEERSRQQLAELEAIYATAPVGLAVIGADCRFLRLNERLAAIHGLPVAAHLGRTVREVLPQFGDCFEEIMRRVTATGEPVLDFEAEGRNPGATRRQARLGRAMAAAEGRRRPGRRHQLRGGGGHGAQGGGGGAAAGQ